MTTPVSIIKRIYDIRSSDLEKSKYEIHEELAREGIRVAHNVIQKVINRNKQLHNIQSAKQLTRRKMQIARVRASRELREKSLGSLVQLDTKHLYILGQKFYVFAAIDCKSRFGLSLQLLQPTFYKESDQLFLLLFKLLILTMAQSIFYTYIKLVKTWELLITLVTPILPK